MPVYGSPFRSFAKRHTRVCILSKGKYNNIICAEVFHGSRFRIGGEIHLVDGKAGVLLPVMVHFFNAFHMTGHYPCLFHVALF